MGSSAVISEGVAMSVPFSWDSEETKLFFLRYQPRLKKFHFRSLGFCYVEIKLFKSVLLKKIPQKNFNSARSY